MTINLDQKIIDIETKEPIFLINLSDAVERALREVQANRIQSIQQFMHYVNERKGDEATVGLVLRRCLLRPIDADADISPEEAQRRFLVAEKMIQGGEFELDTKDRDIIKAAILKVFPDRMISGPVLRCIDPIQV